MSYPQFPLLKTSQTLKWEGVWRELGCLARTASFAVREESGHSLKSSLSVRLCIALEVSPWPGILGVGGGPGQH